MENGAILIACDTAPGLSGAAVQGLPLVWVRSMALMTVTTLATSFPGWQESTELPVVRERGSGRTSRSRGAEIPRIVIGPSEELEAFLDVAGRESLPGPLQGLRQRRGGSVPVGPLVEFIERDLIAVRSLTYRNPATILAFVGGIAATLATKLDALVDPSGYRNVVRASNREKLLESGARGRNAELELVLGMPSATYLEHRVAEGATVREVAEEFERISPTARHLPAKEEARELVAYSIVYPSWEGLPHGVHISETPEMGIATKVVRTEADAHALRGLASLDTAVTTVRDDGDELFAPPR